MLIASLWWARLQGILTLGMSRPGYCYYTFPSGCDVPGGPKCISKLLSVVQCLGRVQLYKSTWPGLFLIGLPGDGEFPCCKWLAQCTVQLGNCKNRPEMHFLRTQPCRVAQSSCGVQLYNCPGILLPGCLMVSSLCIISLMFLRRHIIFVHPVSVLGRCKNAYLPGNHAVYCCKNAL